MVGKYYKKRIIIDKYKKETCEKNGIVLLEIPEVPRLLDVSLLIDYIVDELKVKRIKVPDFKPEEIDLNKAYIKTHAYKIRLLAKEKGGTLLSKGYKGARTKHLFQCNAGHRFELTPDQLYRGSWCLECKGIVLKYTIKDAQDFANSLGGKCLSKEYVNNRKPLIWSCKKRHVFKKNFGTALNRPEAFCPRCSGKLLTVEDMQETARQYGGKFISEKYLGCQKIHHWECKRGHQFVKTPNAVRSAGRWCPICNKKE